MLTEPKKIQIDHLTGENLKDKASNMVKQHWKKKQSGKNE